MRADVCCDIILPRCFMVWSGVADSPREFSEQCQPGTSRRDSSVISQISAIFSVSNFPTLLISSQFSWCTGCVDVLSVLFSPPKQEEVIIESVTISKLMILHRRLRVFCQLLFEMIHYRISRAGKEGEASWRVCIYLTIRWDRTDIWCVPMNLYAFYYLWLLAAGFSGKGKRKKNQKGSKIHTCSQKSYSRDIQYRE